MWGSVSYLQKGRVHRLWVHPAGADERAEVGQVQHGCRTPGWRQPPPDGVAVPRVRACWRPRKRPLRPIRPAEGAAEERL